jgi:hypothetical protein
MKTILTSSLSPAVCTFLAVTPALAQDTVTGAPAGTAPVTVEGYGYGPGQPGYRDNSFGPLGAFVTGMGAPAFAVLPNVRCGVIHDFNGRYTSVCGP